MSAFKSLLSRKKEVAPACMMPLDSSSTTTSVSATADNINSCFVDIMPLSIVELFQSQGCKSCPPVVPLVHNAVMNPNLLLLTYDVTYWDQSADWKDTFGSPQWDQRQRAYITRWGRSGIFTPQIVVNGAVDGIGSRQGEVQEILMKAMEARNQMTWMVGIEMVSDGFKIMSDRAEAETHDVLIIRYDPTPVEIKVGKGPNKGKKIMHRNIVKEMMKLGEWRGGEVSVGLPEMARDRFERVVIVQAVAGGAILAALKL